MIGSLTDVTKRAMELRKEFLRKFNRYPQDLYINSDDFETIKEFFGGGHCTRFLGMSIWHFLDDDSPMRVG